MNWANAMIRNFRGSDNTPTSQASGHPIQTNRNGGAGSGASSSISDGTAITTATGGGGGSMNSQFNSLMGAPDDIVAIALPGRPRLSLEQALDELARAMSRPTCRPAPLPIRGVQFHKAIPQLNTRLPSKSAEPPRPTQPAFIPYLHRSQLTSLTLTGLFRLETFLEMILPLVPELTYLDICLRCYEWRDEIRLDKVLRTCPKLQYLSVDRNMIGRVDFDDPDEKGDSDDDDDDGHHDSKGDMDYDATGDHPAKDKMYVGTSWHVKYAETWSGETNSMNGTNGTQAPGETNSGNGTHGTQVPGEAPNQQQQPPLRQKRFQPRQRPLALRVLKLKKVRMMEQEFVRLLKLCPLLEEMDVFSTIYWGWNKNFLQTIARSCPMIQHLHLTTNYVTGGSDNSNPPGSMQAGFIIIHETPQEQPQPTWIQAGVTGPAATTITTAAAAAAASSTVDASSDILVAAGLVAPGQTPSSLPAPCDPVIELIKLFPQLLSYDARYVRFQDRTLVTLQQTCRQLERLDLTSCREVSSKAVDWFLRHTPTLKHFSASRTFLRIEDLVESAEKHDAAAAAVSAARKKRMYQEGSGEDHCYDQYVVAEESTSLPKRWWVCDGLETFIIGVRSPGQGRGIDLQAEQAADFQVHYRECHSGSSSAAAGGSSQGKGTGFSKLYDHTQYCTFVLFQQLGRLRQLKHLELHGGRFDLGVQPLPFSIYSLGSSESPIVRQSPSSDMHLRNWQQQQRLQRQDKDQQDLGANQKSGSKARRSFNKVKSFLSLGKGKAKAVEDSSVQDSKGKGKAKVKGERHSGGGSSDLGQTGGGFGSNLSDGMGGVIYA
ncbi:hypothetical protein BGZ65_002130, partial [Modicella reniformis]